MELRSNNSLKDSTWQTIGFIGQIMLSMRFILQWVASEKKKESVMPVSFWYFNMFDSIILLSYAIYQQDPVFILGHGFWNGCLPAKFVLYFYRKKQIISNGTLFKTKEITLMFINSCVGMHNINVTKYFNKRIR